MFQLDGTHIVTVEGLGERRSANSTPVQQAMIECHGSQCGFCTPGFVVAMTGLLEESDDSDDEDAVRPDRQSVPLHRLHADHRRRPVASMPRSITRLERTLSERRDAERIRPRSAERVDRSAKLSTVGRHAPFLQPDDSRRRQSNSARSSDAKIVAGATDIGVRINKGVIDPDAILDLNRVAELDGAAIESSEDGEAIVAGARTSWTAIEEICARHRARSFTRSCPSSARRRFGTSARSAATSPTPRRLPIRCRFCTSWKRCWNCAAPAARGP